MCHNCLLLCVSYLGAKATAGKEGLMEVCAPVETEVVRPRMGALTADMPGKSIYLQLHLMCLCVFAKG